MESYQPLDAKLASSKSSESSNVAEERLAEQALLAVLVPPPEPLHPHVHGPVVPVNEATEPVAHRFGLLDVRVENDCPEADPQDPLTADEVYVIVRVSEPVLLLLSFAVTVISLFPLERPIDDMLHEFDPVAVPLDGVQVGHVQFTLDIVAVPEAVPDSELIEDVVE